MPPPPSECLAPPPPPLPPLAGMQFVFAVDYAPVAVRKAAFQHVGGVDEGTSEPGECGIIGDWELSTRMWASGWQVCMFVCVGG